MGFVWVYDWEHYQHLFAPLDDLLITWRRDGWARPLCPQSRKESPRPSPTQDCSGLETRRPRPPPVSILRVSLSRERFGTPIRSSYRPSPANPEEPQHCFLLKIIHVLDTSGKDVALTLVKQEDSGGKRYEVSHLCHANRDDLCLEVQQFEELQHFELEPKATNNRRTKHQNGNDVCDCAKYGDQMCMSNGAIGELVFNDEGRLIGVA